MTVSSVYLSLAKRDALAAAIVTAAVILLVGSGSTGLSNAVDHWMGGPRTASWLVSTAVTLNVALLLFSWRRYRDLQRLVAERALADSTAEHLSATDPLTGFCNRRALLARGAAMVADSRTAGGTLALMLLDLDRFKTVNDMNGHAAGDLVLGEVARRIDRNLPPGTLKARLGGDEFVALIPCRADQRAAIEEIAGQLASSLAEPVDAQGFNVAVGVSIGLAMLADDDDAIGTLLRRADLAMYSRKARGGNGHAWFEPAMEQAALQRSTLACELRDGLSNGAFSPRFTPMVCAASGRVLGMEMQTHWNSPTLGEIAPARVMTLIEDTGLVAPIAMRMFRDAMAEAATWDSRLALAINIPPALLADAWLAQKLVKLLAETGLPPERLEIELVEHRLLEQRAQVSATIASLRNQGVRITLDRFGDAHSAMASIGALPFDRVKLSVRTVRRIAEGASMASVQAIVTLAQDAGIAVAADGVADDATLARLIDAGITMVQGPLYAGRMASTDARDWLARADLMAIASPAMPAARSA